jgi:serine/threonine protein kinase
VYKARDTQLDRIVIIKVLRPPLADQPELRERFEREARTIANLNQPARQANLALARPSRRRFSTAGNPASRCGRTTHGSR